MKVIIVAKTRMGSGACIGALTFEGRSLRLIASDQETNDHFNMDYNVGEVWEVETQPAPNIIPPHVENVIVTQKHRLAPLDGLVHLIEAQFPPLSGGVEVLYDGLTGTTKAGGMYIAERIGMPGRSTMFWRPDKPLVRDDDGKRIRYRYPTPDGGRTLTFVGFQEPIPEIPVGTLLRVSLAHWWRPPEKPEDELRCYVQLSGWYFPEAVPAWAADPRGEPEPVEAGPEPVAVSAARGLPLPGDDHLPHIHQTLQDVFGYPEFRPLQQEIIQNILKKQDTLAIMPTGSGKSLCYQLPALLLPGLTVVVSPLISLMEDQVLQLREWGIPALYLNSTLEYLDYLDATREIKSGAIKLVYAAPETLLRPETTLMLENTGVDCLVIDEAHCISEWGHDFRPEYRQLAGLRARLNGAVTLAVTATATVQVREDIKQTLQIPDANLFIGSFDRPNLHFAIEDKLDALTQARAFLDAHKDQSGIIYCTTRETVDTLSAQLTALGYPALPYHAGMDAPTRRQHQHRFRYEENLIMVATIAFGMGIDKPNVRYILHYDLPKNLESYYQQVGRAGRDGLPANCLLLYSYRDVSTIRYFMPKDDPVRRRGEEQRLKTLLAFVEATGCRRKPLLDYFGESYPHDRCENCDRCQEAQTRPQPGGVAASEPESPPTDLTIPAQKFLSTVKRTRELFGTSHIIDILRGSKAKGVLSKGHDQLTTYGIGRDYTQEQWRHLASQFIRQGLLRRTEPHGSLVVTPEGMAVLKGKTFMGSLPGTFGRAVGTSGPQEYDPALFGKLRACRAALASERGVPPYVIFHDRTLIEMAVHLPLTRNALALIYGVGQRKVEQYGEPILTIIQTYCQDNQLTSVPKVAAPSLPRSASGQQRAELIWERYSQGIPLQEIAAEMALTPGTVLKHLATAHAAGKALHPDGLKNSSTLSEADQQRVLKAFAEHGTQYLRPVFEALGETVSYDELHLWRLIFQIQA